MATTAFEVVSLDEIKRELRLDPSVTDHDEMLTKQIDAAVAFVSRQIKTPLLTDGETMGVADDDPARPALQAAVILVVRQLYDGYREIRPTEAFYALIAPWRRYG